ELMCSLSSLCCVRVLNDTPTTAIYTLSLHDALPISADLGQARQPFFQVVEETVLGMPGLQVEETEHQCPGKSKQRGAERRAHARSEEHTSELQSRENLVCRLLLEKKKKKTNCHRS